MGFICPPSKSGEDLHDFQQFFIFYLPSSLGTIDIQPPNAVKREEGSDTRGTEGRRENG